MTTSEELITEEERERAMRRGFTAYIAFLQGCEHTITCRLPLRLCQLQS